MFRVALPLFDSAQFHNPKLFFSRCTDFLFYLMLIVSPYR